MNLHILSLWDAIKFQPDKPTYAIRLFSSFNAYEDRGSLQKTQLYRRIAEYVFDDNDTYPFRVEVGPKWFNEKIAKNIILGFANYKAEVKALLVHCDRGKNRSPSVALALNEIFDLSHDPDVLMQRHDKYNHLVYETMMEVAKRTQFY